MFSLILSSWRTITDRSLESKIRPVTQAMTQSDKSLAEIRDQIDSIDAEIHALLMRRAKLADDVAVAKSGSTVMIRPAREASILRNLVANHSGKFSKKSIVRIWREIFSAMVSLEGPFSVALYQPEGAAGYRDIARDQYGAYTPITAHHSPRRVIEAVTRGESILGVLPFPHSEDADPWWRSLAIGNGSAAEEVSPKVIAKLPFAGASSTRTQGIEALVIAKLPPEPSGGSGQDQSLLVIEIDDTVSATRMQSQLEKAGINANIVSRWNDTTPPSRWIDLLECEGFIAADDPRLETFCAEIGDALYQAKIIGSYAKPFTDAELAVSNGAPTKGEASS